ncbi:CMRF35-like molecule 5 isoform 3-T3 [Clarias gariepinus]
MKSKAESVFTGTEGGSVDISCKYTDGYQYTPMYLCRDPCAYSDVLIKTEKADIVTSKGRYSALNTVSARSFSVTIRHLTLKDSGVYYCGLETWGPDTLTKVKLHVSKVPTVSTHSPVSRQIQSSATTELPLATTVITATADNSTSYEQTSSQPQTQHYLKPHALVIIYRKTSTNVTCLKPIASEVSHSPTDQEDICHVYDEMSAVYSLAGPATEDGSSGTYCTIQLPAPADTCTDYNPYSLVL